MGLYYPGEAYRNLCRMQGRYRRQSFLLWLTLTSWITCTAGQDILSNCSISLTGSGVISSPNYPLNYSNDLACTWRLQSSSNATNIRLKFSSFRTEASWDVLYVLDEKGIGTSFSGTTLPPIMTLGRTARLVFTTDRSINSTGFNASFTSFDIMNRTQCTTNDVFWCIYSGKCINRNWRCDRQRDCSQGEDEASCVTTTIPPPCGGTLVDSGTIQSPNYPLNYPDNARCSWRLLSRSNDTGIRIQFTSFKLENNYDYVNVYDERNMLTRYTGNVLPPTMLLGKEAKIGFYSDGSSTMQGFTATFVSVSITSQSQCMTSDTFWCTYDRKCISSYWRCDGYVDCTFSEDELLCPSTTAPTTLSPQMDCQRLGKFWCSRSVKCVPSSYRCDNYNDCVYGEDEVNCTNVLQQQCQQSLRFWCGTSRQCISYSWKCDGTNDCRYGEDEEGCAYLSTETITAIAAGSVCGVVLFVLLLAGLIRFMTLRRLRLAHPRSNNYLQTTARPSTTVWSTPATYASQFGAPNRQAGGPPGTGGLPLDQYAPPSYAATINAYPTGQYAYPVAQSGDVRPSSNTPAFTAPSTQ